MSKIFRNTNIQFVREIASAIGLDPDGNIVGITLEMSVRDVARVTVRMLLDKDQDDAVAEVIKHYRIDGPLEPTTSDDAR
jgi:ACT domain-containing protein